MMLGNDHAEIQAAFMGLLASPLVTPWRHPELHVLVHRHAPTLKVWAKRLGYLLAGNNRCYRLRRPPIGRRRRAARGHADSPRSAGACPVRRQLPGSQPRRVTHPPGTVRRRRSAGPDERELALRPNHRPDRQRLLSAVNLLTGHGVLEKRTPGTLQNDWERTGSGIGAGYLLHRDALMLLVNTDDVDLALARRADGGEDTRGGGVATGPGRMPGLVSC